MGNDYLMPSYKKRARPQRDIHLVRRMGIIDEDMEVTEGEQPTDEAATSQAQPTGASMWRALVSVCSDLYEETLEEEAHAALANGNQRPAAQNVTGRAAYDGALVNGVELPVAQNVTIQQENNDDDDEEEEEEDGRFFYDDDDDCDDDDGDGQLVIDENPVPPVPTPSEVALSNATRASVITSARALLAMANASPASEPELEPQPSTSSGSSRTRTGSGSGSSDGNLGPRTSKYFRRPKHMSQVTFNPCVPFEVPVRYNRNMARIFPGTENRTPEQQAIRARNTIAARQSRAKLRVMDEMLHQEAQNEAVLNGYVKERLSACFMYANSVLGKQHLDPVDFMEEFERIKAHYVPEPLRATHQVPRAAPRPCPEAYILDSDDDYEDDSDDDYDTDDGYEEEFGDDNEPRPGTSADTMYDRRDY